MSTGLVDVVNDCFILRVDEQAILDVISNEYSVGDVFSTEDIFTYVENNMEDMLKLWAESSGYSK